MEREHGIHWRARLIEGVVIIFSILAAFSIDAWWDGVQEHRRAQAQIASLVYEFRSIDARLDEAAKELQGALDATRALARNSGPHPSPMPLDTFALMFMHALTVNALVLPTGALTNILSSGDLPILNNIDLQKDLAAWPSIATLMAVKFDYLVDNRDQHILPYVNTRMAVAPGVALLFGPEAHDEHMFPFASSDILADRGFENYMTERTINIMIAAGTVRDAQKLAGTITRRLAAWPRAVVVTGDSTVQPGR